jgi:hypothetical protein
MKTFKALGMTFKVKKQTINYKATVIMRDLTTLSGFGKLEAEAINELLKKINSEVRTEYFKLY